MQELGLAHLHGAQTGPEAPRRRPGALYAAVARDESAVAWHSRGGPLGPQASHAARSCEECKPGDCFAPVSTSKVCYGCCTSTPEPLCTTRNTSEGDPITHDRHLVPSVCLLVNDQAQPLRGWPGRFCLAVCLCLLPARSSVLASLSSVLKPSQRALLKPLHRTRAAEWSTKPERRSDAVLAACRGYADGSLSLARP